MLNIKAAALSVVVAIGAIAGASSAASADTLRFTVDEDGGVGVGVEINDRYDRDRGPRWDRDRDGPRWDRDRDGPRPGWGGGYGRPAYGPACSPWRAEGKARDMGLRRARVVDVDGRKIVVVGRKWGERQTVIFGRSPNCPVRAVF